MRVSQHCSVLSCAACLVLRYQLVNYSSAGESEFSNSTFVTPARVKLSKVVLHGVWKVPSSPFRKTSHLGSAEVYISGAQKTASRQSLTWHNSPSGGVILRDSGLPVCYCELMCDYMTTAPCNSDRRGERKEHCCVRCSQRQIMATWFVQSFRGPVSRKYCTKIMASAQSVQTLDTIKTSSPRETAPTIATLHHNTRTYLLKDNLNL